MAEKIVKDSHGLVKDLANDCISRQAAIDAFGLSEKTRKYGGDHSGYDTMMLYEIQNTLESLPPAQPASYRQVTGKLDCISRQDAIDRINKQRKSLHPDFYEQDYIGDAAYRICAEFIERLPSAQPDSFVDADTLKRCRFEYINACKIVARPTPDTSKSDIYDAHAVIKALHPIFGDVEF